MMTVGRDHLSKADAVTIAAIEAGLPTLAEARQSIDRFHAMIRRKIKDDLTSWLRAAHGGLIVFFANGIATDEAAVRAAIATSGSNGQSENQVTRLKLVKRQMYGRAKIDLLQARLIGAAWHERSRPSSKTSQSHFCKPKHGRAEPQYLKADAWTSMVQLS